MSRIAADELAFGWGIYCEARQLNIGFSIPDSAAEVKGTIPGYTREEYEQMRIDDDKTSGIRMEWVTDFIKTKITEHIAEDGKRLELWEAGAEEREKQRREEEARKEAERREELARQNAARLLAIEVDFISKTTHKFGEEVLRKILPSEKAKYKFDVAAGGDADELWCSLLEKYAPDQNTDSCLYFIKQGTATKIGITDSLGSRLAQIRTSAALPCEVANVVYTHFGRQLEKKLHQCLSRYNSHLEWFVLPREVEERLFKAKSREEIDEFLKMV